MVCVESDQARQLRDGLDSGTGTGTVSYLPDLTGFVGLVDDYKVDFQVKKKSQAHGAVVINHHNRCKCLG